MNTIILESTEQGDMPVDVYQKLANDRILFLSGVIDDEMATDVTANLLLKDHEDPDKKISLFINSIGGNIRNVLMIYDMIQIIDAPVETVCIGAAFDESLILLCAGESRLATKNAIISVGQLEQDWSAHVDMPLVKKIMQMAEEDNKRMMQIFSDATGKSVKQIMQDFERKVFMNSAKALKYGFIDKVIAFNK